MVTVHQGNTESAGFSRPAIQTQFPHMWQQSLSESERPTINLYSNQRERVTGNPLQGFTHFHLQRPSNPYSPAPINTQPAYCRHCAPLILQNGENEMEQRGGFTASLHACRLQCVS